VNEIRISGFGGQGVIRCGYIIGKTAALYDGKNATLTQSFGPEARGSACSAQIIVDEAPVRYPYLTTPDTVVAMSQEAYDKFGADIKSDGTLMIDDDLVEPSEAPAVSRIYAIAATRIAEELGNRIAANIVMLGFFTAVTNIISVEAARRALPSSVPSRFLELNQKAFEAGYKYGADLMGVEPVPTPEEWPSAAEYRLTNVTRAKAGRRATVLARAHRLTAKDLESEEAKLAWKKAAKKGQALKAAARKELDEKTAAAGTRVTKKPASRKEPPKKARAKKATARKAGVKKPAAKKAATKKAGVKKPAAKKATARKAGAKRRTAKKATTKKAGAKRRTAKKATTKKAGVKKPAAKKATAKKAVVRKAATGKARAKKAARGNSARRKK
jgi:2-oxoglutarate ferredoxin oxidoreductase subunit gamma